MYLPAALGFHLPGSGGRRELISPPIEDITVYFWICPLLLVPDRKKSICILQSRFIVFNGILPRHLPCYSKIIKPLYITPSKPETGLTIPSTSLPVSWRVPVRPPSETCYPFGFQPFHELSSMVLNMANTVDMKFQT